MCVKTFGFNKELRLCTYIQAVNNRSGVYLKLCSHIINPHIILYRRPDNASVTAHIRMVRTTNVMLMPYTAALVDCGYWSHSPHSGLHRSEAWSK